MARAISPMAMTLTLTNGFVLSCLAARPACGGPARAAATTALNLVLAS